MNTRYLTLLFVTAAGASFALGACGSEPTPLDPSVEARLRNDLPPFCTAEKIQACPAVQVTRCPAGQEPVIDYVSDCCAQFTCQPLCASAQRGSCPRTPAPACPAGTRLWIGTAIEDCCPAYRCEPDGTTCDPARGDRCGCDATNVACTLALPYCGPNVQPTVVGQTADCCPIYQCPCAMPGDGTPPPTAADARYCGCTTPNCRAGEQIVCEKQDVCGGPCTCKPATGICREDTICGPDRYCDLSACRLPPRPADAAAAVCDPATCGPKPDIATRACADGSIAGVTDRCLQAADGTCKWEIRDCASDCFGICAPKAPQTGCRADADCPAGQACNIACREWECIPGGTGTGTPAPTDPGTGTTPPAACACDATDNSCACNAAGACKGRTCVGQCAPAPTPVCDPTRPPACPAIAVDCQLDANGNRVEPIRDGVDERCCPKWTCPAPPPVCDPAASTSSTGAGRTCPAMACPADAPCAKVISVDPGSCCPKYECNPRNADRTCS